MYKDKKFVTVGVSIYPNEASPNLDYRYGPYASVQEAWTELKKTGVCVGQTVGIMNADGSVDEYWFKNKCQSANDLVKKIVAQQTVDAYTKAETDAKLAGKANTADVNNALSNKADKSEIPNITGKADKATTLAGYGIADAYTKTEADAKVTAATGAIANAVSESAASAERAEEKATICGEKAEITAQNAAEAIEKANEAVNTANAIDQKIANLSTEDPNNLIPKVAKNEQDIAALQEFMNSFGEEGEVFTQEVEINDEGWNGTYSRQWVDVKAGQRVSFLVLDPDDLFEEKDFAQPSYLNSENIAVGTHPFGFIDKNKKYIFEMPEDSTGLTMYFYMGKKKPGKSGNVTVIYAIEKSGVYSIEYKKLVDFITGDKIVSESKDIKTDINLKVRNCYIYTNLKLDYSKNWLVSDTFLVKKGQTIELVAGSTGQGFVLVAVDNGTSITDENVTINESTVTVTDNLNRTFKQITPIVDNTANEIKWTASEDTYVIVQCWKNIVQLNVKLYDWYGVRDEIEMIKEDLNPSKYSYVSEEKNRIMNYLLSDINKHDLVVFGFNTDQHISQDDEIHNACVFRGLNAMRDMANEYPFDLIVLGGDEAGYHSGDFVIENVIKDVVQCYNEADTPACPVINIAGNHEAYQNIGNANSNGAMMYNLKTKRPVSRGQVVAAGKNSTNMYYDDVAKHIRYIFTDTFSVKQTEYDTVLAEAFGDTKLFNSEWEVIVFSHQAVTHATNNSVITKIRQFVDNGGRIAMCVNGHEHGALHSVESGFNVIQCDCAATHSAYESFDGIKYTKKAGTATETAFDVFVYDRTDKKINVLHFGCGMDRIFKTGENAGAQFITVSGSVTNGSAGYVVKMIHHNTVYQQTLESNKAFSFPYICPERDWTIQVWNANAMLYEDTITAGYSNISKQITV